MQNLSFGGGLTESTEASFPFLFNMEMSFLPFDDYESNVFLWQKKKKKKITGAHRCLAGLPPCRWPHFPLTEQHLRSTVITRVLFPAPDLPLGPMDTLTQPTPFTERTLDGFELKVSSLQNSAVSLLGSPRNTLWTLPPLSSPPPKWQGAGGSGQQKSVHLQG